jgi:hypothetical protein
MNRKLLVAAAMAACLALPAQAQHRMASPVPHTSAPQFRATPAPGTVDRCSGSRTHRASAFCDGFAYADGQWALYNNRSWEPESYNDWWNDRPDRAYPRWVQEQQARGTCEPDRMWWSGSGWHC